MEILMVRPFQFYFNQQTAANNFFQSNINIENANELAIAEFDVMVAQLRAHQIKVNVVQDTKDPSTPDAIFPNNWISTHAGGTLCLYPMYAENRRAERKSTVLDFLYSNYKIQNVLD
ncbi:MAG: arginine deiminase-related protein, partial [Sediminibacterium sp.]